MTGRGSEGGWFGGLKDSNKVPFGRGLSHWLGNMKWGMPIADAVSAEIRLDE